MRSGYPPASRSGRTWGTIMKPELGNDANFILHHIGIAVPDLDDARESLQQLFGFKVCSGPFDDVAHKVKVCFLRASPEDAVAIELVAPLSTNSPVAAIIERSRMTSYHMCLETPDLMSAISRAKKSGCVVVSEPSPAVAFRGRRIAWICMGSDQLIELLESEASDMNTSQTVTPSDPVD